MFREVGLRKIPAAQRLRVTEQATQTRIEAAIREPDRLRAARDQAVLPVMISCGLRRSELRDLRVPDVELSQAPYWCKEASSRHA